VKTHPQRLVILMYHIVAEPLSAPEVKYACPPQQFERHMRFLRARHPVVALDEVESWLTGGGALPPGAVAVTFDDGTSDLYHNAFPVLRRYGIPATIFLTTGALGASNRWAEDGGLPRREMLSWDQVEQMSRFGISFGAHTVSHPRLNLAGAERAQQEIEGSRDAVQARLSRRAAHFAYPYGACDAGIRSLVQQAGFSLACSVQSGFNTRGADPLLLRRIEVYGGDRVWNLSQKMTFGMNDSSRLFPLKYYGQRLLDRFR